MSQPRISWDTYFMSIAVLSGMRSPDPSTQVGAVIVDRDKVIQSVGYNGWPRGIEAFADDDPRWNRPEKYFWMSHAEENAILNAGRIGVKLEGCSLYVPIHPCAGCARMILQVGITEVIVSGKISGLFAEHMRGDQKWIEGVEHAKQMFLEKGITTRVLEDEYMPGFSLRLCGTLHHLNAPAE